MVLRFEDNTVGALAKDVEKLKSGFAKFLLIFDSLLLLPGLALSPRDLRFLGLSQLSDVDLRHVSSFASINSGRDASGLESIEFFLEVALVHGLSGITRSVC